MWRPRDNYVPLNAARSAREAFAKKEFGVRLTELPNQRHDYQARAALINEKAWEFFRQHALSSDPTALRFVGPNRHAWLRETARSTSPEFKLPLKQTLLFANTSLILTSEESLRC